MSSTRSEDLSRLKEHLEPPWDEVKEQRVLTRVLATRSAPRKYRIVLPAAAVVAIAACVALIVSWRGFSLRDAPTAAPSSFTAVGDQVMALADGSQAVLVHEAGLQVEEERPDRVKIIQRRGTVRYEVRPDKHREFSVRAAGNTIRVRGTVFTVDMSGGSVEVAVQRGRVEIDDGGGRTRELSEGESLRVPVRDSKDEAVLAGPVTTATVEAPDAQAAPSVEPSAAPHQAVSGAPLTVGDLQAKADRARVSGDLPTAAAALEQLVATDPRDPRVPNALFSLARVERERGHEAAAARAFERCMRAAPSGPLVQDAMAEAAVSWSVAGATKAARANATSYLARYPNGPHVQRMKAILDQ
jgi:transmembrane sensor